MKKKLDKAGIVWLGVVGVTSMVYWIRNPEQTEMQVFLEFFKWNLPGLILLIASGLSD